MKMEFVDVGGTPTRCILAGDAKAPPVMLLHGQALTADVWSRNIDALAEKHRVVAPDMLGHGFTRPASDAAVDIPAKLDHLKALAETLGLGRFAICGSSYGALLGTQLFLRDPQMVSRLVINGSGSCFNTDQQLAVQVQKLFELYAPTLTRSTPEMWHARIGNNFFDKAKIPPELPVLAALCYAQPWAAVRWRETIDTMLDPARFRPFRILERLEEVTAPALIVWGREDRGGSLDSALAAVARMPDARLVTFDGCGHYPMLEHAQEYNRLVGEFLAG